MTMKQTKRERERMAKLVAKYGDSPEAFENYKLYSAFCDTHDTPEHVQAEVNWLTVEIFGDTRISKGARGTVNHTSGLAAPMNKMFRSRKGTSWETKRVVETPWGNFTSTYSIESF